MERAEKQGLAVAAVGHLALFALLSLGLFSARIPKPPLADSMDVTIADMAGMQSAAPRVSTEAPKASQAPEQGKPEDSAPPPPAPQPTPPPPPEPKPPAPEPKPSLPEPKPTPPKPEPKPVPPRPEKTESKPEKKPEPKPEKPKPEKPEPEKPKDKPKPEKPAPEKPAKPAPAKPTPEKATTEKAAPARTTSKASTSKKPPGLPSDFLKDLPKDTGSGTTKGADKPKGSRLGKDFLKGIGSDAAGKADAPRASAVSARSMAGLVGIIAAKVKPCYNPPAGGADAGSIVTVLSIRMNRDGSVASVTAGAQTGVNGSNQAYARQMADAARRAVLRCSPITGLPADLYQGGWDDFDFRFRPDAMQ